MLEVRVRPIEHWRKIISLRVSVPVLSENTYFTCGPGLGWAGPGGVHEWHINTTRLAAVRAAVEVPVATALSCMCQRYAMALAVRAEGSVC